ncbi:MAG TPA: hypothetical protein VGS07_30265 [Thermoanaerobaculia bacterium]|jgi:hypothetical protein|nr:hypothetical protein [Thermoanaerobaculia bacterium]
MKKITLKLALAAALVTGTLALPAPSQAVFTGCNPNVLCPDVYSPVICSNGHVYSNGCYASKACATGCVPYGLD